MAAARPSFIALSMSSRLAGPCSWTRNASRPVGTSRRFTTKPVESPQFTAVLPSASTQALASASTAGSVRTVFTTSTSFMSGTGLKKCSPITRPGRFVNVASSVIDRLEVFEANTAGGAHSASSDENSSRLSARF